MSVPSPPSSPPAAEETFNPALEVDRGLTTAGFGWYSAKLCLILYATLLASVMEMLGNSMVLPAARCDLNMSDQQRGFVTSIPFIGIALTSYVHGYLVDTKGRKKMLMYTTLLAGIFSFISALMPEIISYSICKFMTALCITGPSAFPYAYIAEIVSLQHRDIALAMANAFQITTSVLVPLLAWVILPMNFRINFGLYEFRSWRLLSMIYASFMMGITYLLRRVPSSPKFVLASGNADGALKILQTIYTGNTRKPLETFPIKKLSIPPDALEHETLLKSLISHTAPLLERKYFKYLLLNGILMFGIFSILNGLHLWIPDLVSRVFSNTNQQGKSACDLIREKYQNQVPGSGCDDSINHTAFYINIVSIIVCSVISIPLAFTLNYIGRRRFLSTTYIIMGTFCVLVNNIRVPILFAVLMSSFPLMALQIGIVNAYSVAIFPTLVRGMVVCLTMMMGRIGGIVANVITGGLITKNCEAVFYMFASVLILCGLLSCLHKK